MAARSITQLNSTQLTFLSVKSIVSGHYHLLFFLFTRENFEILPLVYPCQLVWFGLVFLVLGGLGFGFRVVVFGFSLDKLAICQFCELSKKWILGCGGGGGVGLFHGSFHRLTKLLFHRAEMTIAFCQSSFQYIIVSYLGVLIWSQF